MAKSKKLTKKQIEKFAKIHASIFLSYLDGEGFEDSPLSFQENQRLIDGVCELASKIGEGLPQNFSSNGEIIKYVQENF